jgi:hypothetical protein
MEFTDFAFLTGNRKTVKFSIKIRFSALLGVYLKVCAGCGMENS